MLHSLLSPEIWKLITIKKEGRIGYEELRYNPGAESGGFSAGT